MARRSSDERWLQDLPDPLRRRDRALREVRARVGTPVRRRMADGPLPVPLGRRVRRWLELDGTATGRPDGGLRIQVGSGTAPVPGWLHVDTERGAAHLEHRAPPWRLPFGDGGVVAVLAVDLCERLTPAELAAALDEWHRVLVPGGTVEIHGHDATAALRAYLGGDAEHKWAATGAIFGLPSDPGDRGAPPAPRRCMLDADLLGDLLGRAGFCDVRRLGTAPVPAADAEALGGLVPGLRMVLSARRGRDTSW